MEVALCNAKPDSQSEKKGSKKLNESNGFHEKSNLQCAQGTSSMKDTQMEEPSVNVTSDLLQVGALPSEGPKRKRKKKSSAPITSVGTSVAENCMPIVDSTLHPHVAEFSEQAIEQEVSEPRTEGNITKTNLESSEPIAGLSCSRKKKGKPKKRCKSRDCQDESCGNDICDGSSPVENIVPGIDPSPQPPASELSEQELNLAQSSRDGIGTTSAEDPRPSADFCCPRKKKGKLKKSCKSRDGNDESCGNDICDGTSPVENIISGIDPSQQLPVLEFSEEVLESSHPIMERMSITSSEDPKPTASLSCSQEKKKGNRKKRRKTNANKDESCENDEESCGKDKRCDLCVGTSSVDNNMPGRDPPRQAVVSEISKQKLELPQTDMEGISPTSSEGPKPDADLSSLQEKNKKNRKKRRKTQESNDERYAVDKTCERNDETCGESKTCNLSLGTSVENIIPGLEPSQQPSVSEFSEQKQDLPHQAEEGICPTSSEGPKPDTDLSSLQEKKKKNRKKRRKTQESNDEGCADDKTCERSDESCGKSKTCNLCLGTSVEKVIPGLEPSQQRPVSEFSEQKQDLRHPAKEGISPTSSEGPKPDANLSSLNEQKKKNRKKRRKTQGRNDEGCADDKTCEINDESCGEDKTCNLSLGTLLETIIPELDPSQQPPVSEFSKQKQDVPHPAVEGIGPFPEGPETDADLSSLQVKKKKNRKKRRKTQESEDEGCVDETCERNDESCGEGKRCNLFLGTSVENIMPGFNPSQQPPVSEILVQMQDVMHPARDGISTSSSEVLKPIADSSCSQEKKKKNRKRRRKTNEINDDSCGNDKPPENNDESCGKNKRCDLSSLDNIMPPIEQPPVSKFLEQELELPQPLMVGIITKSSEGNEDNSFSQGKKTELTDKKVEVSSLPLLAVKADVDVAVTEEEANLSQISNPGGDRSLVSSSKKKLLILDVNGLLADIVSIERSVHLRYEPDITISRKAVFKRPYCDEFLQFCFDKFNVGVWSSRTRKNVDMVVDFLFGDSRNKLLFCWDQKHCTPTRFKTLDNQDKPIVLKELRKLWEKLDPDLPWVRGEYNESNTILLDDSPYKALRNPVNTSIFPYSYHYKVRNDQALGPSGRLRKYLVKLADADNVQKFVEQNPFGQGAITETNLSWAFYRRVMEDGVQLPTNG